MSCPRCHSHDLWDDNLAWGCNSCDFFTTGAVRNVVHPKDTWNQPRPKADEGNYERRSFGSASWEGTCE